MSTRLLALCGLAVTAVAVAAAAAVAGPNESGFKTSRPSMVTPMLAGVTVTPILSVGDTLKQGYRFEAIPDGISIRARGQGRADIYVNHETSKTPFPYVRAAPTAANSENDFDNSQVSHLIVNQHSQGILNASYAIDSSMGYQRLCSNYLATSKEGFSRPVFFTNEETPDWVFRREASWPPPIGHPDEKEGGLVVALDVQRNKRYEIHGMGRHNHENSVPLPGYDDLVVLSGDDTFTSGPLLRDNPPGGEIAPAQSQLYSYIAADTDSLLADEGALWAFVSDTEGVTDYYDIAPGSGTEIEGHFIPVPPKIASGLDDDGSELKAADVGYPLPPNNGSWQLDPRSIPALGIDGPQWVLEYWSDTHDVFQFVRIEDIAYDKRPGMENVVYVIDSGRGRRPTDALDTTFRSTNGRVWRMVFDKDDPTVVTSMTVFVEGDDSPVQTLNEIHQPDNIESTPNGILVTEDPGSSQQFPAGSALPNATTARLWFVPFAGAGTPQVVVRVDQSADGGPTDVDGRAAGNWGAWETSGIVDASAAFGPNMFLLAVQAHTLWVERAPGDDNNRDGQPDFTYKREGGQLILLRIPGA